MARNLSLVRCGTNAYLEIYIGGTRDNACLEIGIGGTRNLLGFLDEKKSSSFFLGDGGGGIEKYFNSERVKKYFRKDIMVETKTNNIYKLTMITSNYV